MKRINLISCPRNLSTALMYSFAQRPDTKIVDEPMYAHYLVQSGSDHPGKQEIIDSMESNLQKIKDQVLYAQYDCEILFVKNMSHHFYDIDESFLLDFSNVIYIRDPKKIIASFAQVITDPNVRDVGIEKQFELFQFLDKNGHPPIILDSGELLKDPEKVLRELCLRLEIPFNESMLQWEAGPRPEDGIWAKYWYENVHQSTGFSKQKTSERNLPEGLESLHNQTMNYYNQLLNLAIKA